MVSKANEEAWGDLPSGGKRERTVTHFARALKAAGLLLPKAVKENQEITVSSPNICEWRFICQWRKLLIQERLRVNLNIRFSKKIMCPEIMKILYVCNRIGYNGWKALLHGSCLMLRSDGRNCTSIQARNCPTFDQ